MTDTMIGGKRCLLFDTEKPKVLLVQTMGQHEVKGITDEVEMIRRQTDVPFAMAAFNIADWEQELMPWHDPAVSHRKEVGEGAGKTLQYVSDELLPVLRMRYGLLPVVLGGYSLGGLFSLWATSLTGEFAAVNACSPSLWIRDWMAFAREHPLKAPVAYMSLGNREERSKNKAISRVGDCVRAEHLLLQEQLGSDRCTLVWNEGNHFVHGAERTAHGFAWCLEKLKTNIQIKNKAL